MRVIHRNEFILLIVEIVSVQFLASGQIDYRIEFNAQNPVEEYEVEFMSSSGQVLSRRQIYDGALEGVTPGRSFETPVEMTLWRNESRIGILKIEEVRIPFFMLIRSKGKLIHAFEFDASGNLKRHGRLFNRNRMAHLASPRGEKT